jgi:hypothetical protein
MGTFAPDLGDRARQFVEQRLCLFEIGVPKPSVNQP